MLDPNNLPGGIYIANEGLLAVAENGQIMTFAMGVIEMRDLAQKLWDQANALATGNLKDGPKLELEIKT